MPLSLAELKQVLQELAPVLPQAWIQKIHQPTPSTVTLDLRAAGRTLTLLLSAHPEAGRIHLTRRRLPNPPQPLPFCRFLRAHLQGGRIEAIEQVDDDRLVALRISARGASLTLLVELTGRNADLLLLDSQGAILRALRGERRKPGESYCPPRGGRRQPISRAEAPIPPPSPAESAEHAFPISASLDEHYHAYEADRARERLRQARLIHVRKTIKKLRRRREGLETDLEKASRYREYARYGELLKQHLGTIHKGQDRITVIDYFDPALPELVIPLDPAKDARRNLDDYFKKHRKYQTAQRELEPRIERTTRDLHALEAEHRALEDGAWEPLHQEDLRGFPTPPSAASATGSQEKTRAKTDKRAGPFRRFLSFDQHPIYVGRNARENDELSTKFARSNDLWLHARGVPGSHVVVRLAKGAKIPRETLLDAANLALLYSDFKKSGKGDVIYTRGKWVKKAKGQPPGTVTVTQEETLFVTLDRTRLDRLKESGE